MKLQYFFVCLCLMLLGRSIASGKAVQRTTVSPAGTKPATASVVDAGSSQSNSKLAEKIRKINAVASAEKKEDDRSVQNLAYKFDSDVNSLTIDKDLAASARDKSLDWRTRYLLLERIGHGENKKISKDDEMTGL